MEAIDWLARRSLYAPEKVSLIEVSSGRRFTYQELNQQANRVANWLEAMGVKPGERVALLAGNCAEVLFVLFAALKIGAIFLPLNYKLALPELLPILEDAQPTLLIYGAEFRATVDASRGPALLPRTVQLEAGPETPDPVLAVEVGRHSLKRDKEIPVNFDAPAMILYTSGTTGKSKGAVLPHRMIFWNSVNFFLRDLLPSDTVLVHTPMFYTGGLNVYTLPALILGGTVVLMKSWNADEALRVIERERVSVFFAVPTQLLMMFESPLYEAADLGALRYVISGGAPCPPSIVERTLERGLRYEQGMGLTEVGPNCFALEARDAMRKAGSIGFPNPAIQARVVDEEGKDVGPNGVGELILKTPAMIDKYWNNPEATAEAIRDGWFYTGDLARRDAEGFYFLVDRKKDMYISGGENIYPAEIENVFLQHAKVAEVAVVGVPHPKWGEVGCAAIVLRPGEQATEEDLLSFCQGKIAKYKIPKHMVFVSTLPRTHSGKIQKHILKKHIRVDRPTIT